jgi:hypothetical protein
MKFDAARASATFQRLGDPAFRGPDSEARIADYVAGEFERMGWRVERRDVRGSRFPQRAAPWVGWLGYGIFITIGYFALIVAGQLSLIVLLLLLFVQIPWLNAILSNEVRSIMPQLSPARAPLLIGSLRGEPAAPVRVVFHSVLGGLETDLFQSSRQSRFWMCHIAGLLIWIPIIVLSVIWHRGRFPSVILVSITALFLVVPWTMILRVLYWEYYQSGPTTHEGAVERRGLAVLLELARTWPPGRSRRIEPVFIAAGGQRLNYAGSREFLHILEREWRAKPTLLVLFFAPGAGEAIRLAPVHFDVAVLARNSAESLWIPTWGDDAWTLLPFWPFEKQNAAEPIALIGSDPRAFFDPSVSPEALDRAAQLATEIALRWAKQKAAQVASSQASSTISEGPNEQGGETP